MALIAVNVSGQCQDLFGAKILLDPSFGQQTITKIDLLGVLLGHFLFGVGLTFFLDWSWIPLTKKERNSGISLEEIKKNWNWD